MVGAGTFGFAEGSRSLRAFAAAICRPDDFEACPESNRELTVCHAGVAKIIANAMINAGMITKENRTTKDVVFDSDRHGGCGRSCHPVPVGLG